MIARITRGDTDTHELAGAIAELAAPGELVVLVGGLGAGKTRFVQGFADAMGVADPATSPTFALVHLYEGRVPIFHADLYRLASEHEVLDLGLDEALADGAIALVEWGDIAGDLLARDRLVVTITHALADSETTRHVALDPCGPSWDDRIDALEHKTQRWQP